LDEEGSGALIQLPVPVNKYPEFVGLLVRFFKTHFPMLGKSRIANVLCRAGLHLSATTVRRMLRDEKNPPSARGARKQVSDRVVTASRPNETWHSDLTTIPTSLGFWVPWIPLAIPQIWPFC